MSGCFSTYFANDVTNYANIEWCTENLQKYHVKPMKSWGKLPEHLIKEWKEKQCDLVFTAQRMGVRELSQCDHSNVAAAGEVAFSSSSLSSSGGMALFPNVLKRAATGYEKLPLIAIMAATTTRKVARPSTSTLALFT